MSSSIPKLRLPRAIAFTSVAAVLAIAACEATTPMNVETPAPQQAEPEAVAAAVETPVEVLPAQTVGDPLTIIDGVIVDRGVADLDPRSIEHIEVIKGAAAEQLYGPRGRDGVISIVTKKDTEARAEVAYRELADKVTAMDEVKRVEERARIGAEQVRELARKEVVVVGRPKADVEMTVRAELVDKVKTEALLREAEVEQVLEARKAGIVKLDGRPLSKIGGPQPIFMINGVIVDTVELDRLPLQDIERIEVVKGAAAVALYGPQAANGVINITTKK